MHAHMCTHTQRNEVRGQKIWKVRKAWNTVTRAEPTAVVFHSPMLIALPQKPAHLQEADVFGSAAFRDKTGH